MRLRRVALVSIGAILLILLVGPLIVPIPALEGTVPPTELADPDSRFIEVNGINVHYKVYGNGEPAILLLHGFGASLFSWREVIEPLGNYGTVIAFDLPAFGLTSRPMPGEWVGTNPYSLEGHSNLTVALMDRLGIQKAILVGHSVGGTVSVLIALQHLERVAALVLVDPAIYPGGGTPDWLRYLSFLPQVDRLGPLLIRSIATEGLATLNSAWHDPSKITPEITAGYTKPLKAENWDYALWEYTVANHPLGLEKQLNQLNVPVLVITGDDDRLVPTNQSIRLASEISGAQLSIVPDCGHLPHEECPDAFMQEVVAFLMSNHFYG